MRNDIIMQNTIYTWNKLINSSASCFRANFYKNSSFFDAANSVKQLANKSRVRSSDRWLGRSEGEEIDDNFVFDFVFLYCPR